LSGRQFQARCEFNGKLATLLSGLIEVDRPQSQC
jgi:hypothetical protein